VGGDASPAIAVAGGGSVVFVGGSAVGLATGSEAGSVRFATASLLRRAVTSMVGGGDGSRVTPTLGGGDALAVQSLVLLTAPLSPFALSAGGAFTQWTGDPDGSGVWTPAGLLSFRTPLCGRSEGVHATSPDAVGAYAAVSAPDAAAEPPASVLFRGNVGG